MLVQYGIKPSITWCFKGLFARVIRGINIITAFVTVNGELSFYAMLDV